MMGSAADAYKALDTGAERNVCFPTSSLLFNE